MHAEKEAISHSFSAVHQILVHFFLLFKCQKLGDCQEGIAFLLQGGNDLPKCIKRVSASAHVIVKQKNIAAAHALHHTFCDDVGGRTRPIACIHSPQNHRIIHFLCNLADLMRAKPLGRTEKLRLFARQLDDLFFRSSHFFGNAVTADMTNAGVRIGMIADLMPCFKDHFGTFGIIGNILTDHKKGRADAVHVKKLQNLLRIARMRSVVKG